MKTPQIKHKTLFIGDIHGLAEWDNIALAGLKQFYEIVFLGDYVDSFFVRPVEQLANLKNLCTFIRKNITLTAIILFIIIFSILNLVKPGFLYNPNGSVRQFGVGYKNKTILPVWLVAIVLGILSYLFVLYYLVHPQIIM